MVPGGISGRRSPGCGAVGGSEHARGRARRIDPVRHAGGQFEHLDGQRIAGRRAFHVDGTRENVSAPAARVLRPGRSGRPDVSHVLQNLVRLDPQLAQKRDRDPPAGSSRAATACPPARPSRMRPSAPAADRSGTSQARRSPASNARRPLERALKSPAAVAAGAERPWAVTPPSPQLARPTQAAIETISGEPRYRVRVFPNVGRMSPPCIDCGRNVTISELEPTE